MTTNPPYELVEMDSARGKELTDKITALLEEYNCEMGVKTQIHIWQRQPKPIVSPIQPGMNDGNENTTA